MIKKLMTFKRFEETFKPNAKKWEKDSDGNIHIIHDELYWCINPTMISMFGEYIEVKECNVGDSTHMGTGGYVYLWHELWFEPEYQLLKEDDVLL